MFATRLLHAGTRPVVKISHRGPEVRPFDSAAGKVHLDDAFIRPPLGMFGGSAASSAFVHSALLSVNNEPGKF